VSAATSLPGPIRTTPPRGSRTGCPPTGSRTSAACTTSPRPAGRT
jgi:hypothetical protein